MRISSGPLAGKRVVVDAGHGGRFTGAVGRELGVQEKDVNLDVSLRLRDKLEAMGAEVRLTRVTDSALTPPEASLTEDLQARVDVANQWPADLYVSVHSNNSQFAAKNGTSCYRAPDASGRARALAALTHRQMARQLGLTGLGVLTADFHVLKHTRMPATLVEIAYLSNPREERLLAQPAFRERVAEALADGVADYFSVEGMLKAAGA